MSGLFNGPSPITANIGQDLQNSLSFSTGGLLGGSGGVMNWDNSGTFGAPANITFGGGQDPNQHGGLGQTQSNSLQGGLNNRTIDASLMAYGGYEGGLFGKLLGALGGSNSAIGGTPSSGNTTNTSSGNVQTNPQQDNTLQDAMMQNFLMQYNPLYQEAGMGGLPVNPMYGAALR